MSLFQPVYMDTNIYERTISHQKRHCNKHKHLVVRSPWDNHQLRHSHSDSKGCSGKRKLRSKMLSCVSLLLFWGSIIITLLLPQTTFAVNSTYYLIPTREGLAVQLMSLNNAYVRVVKSYNRILILVPFTSEHYKDTDPAWSVDGIVSVVTKDDATGTSTIEWFAKDIDGRTYAPPSTPSTFPQKRNRAPRGPH